MTEPNAVVYPLVVYSTDFRWTGETPVPSHRRLSDFLNDRTLLAFVLHHVIPATWENNLWREGQKIESLALLKRNIAMIVPGANSPPPPPAPLDRVRKAPTHVIIHLPSFTVEGDLNLLYGADWLHVVTSAPEDFFPVTKAGVWHTKTRTQLETGVKFMLVNRQGILGFEVSKNP